MKEEMNHIDDLFRDGMEGHVEMPSPLVWDKIEDELNKKDKKRPFLFFLTSCKKSLTIWLVALFLASITGISYFLLHATSDTNHRFVQVVSENQKENSKNKLVSTQLKQHTAHHTNADLNTKETENSKEQLGNKNPSNDAVANRPYVHESVPFKNKTDVAGSPTIIQSAGNVNNNASAVQVTEEQTNRALIATVNEHQHELGPIVKTVVSFKTEANNVKTPATLAAPAANVSSVQADQTSEQKKKTKNIFVSLTPVFQNQVGKMRLVDIPPPPPQVPPIVTFSRFKMEATDYTKSAGLYAGLHIGKKWSIQSGLLYSTQYFKTDTTFSEAVLRPDGNIKYMIENVAGSLFIDPLRGDNPTPGSLVDVYRLTTAFSYIQIPFQVNYYFGKGKLQAFTTLGGTYNKFYRLSLKGVMKELNAKHIINDKELSLNTSYIHAVLGGGIQWHFYKQISFLLAPQYHLSITPNYKSSDQKSYPNNLTVQTGFQVRLHK